jgi:hypothetical protein
MNIRSPLLRPVLLLFAVVLIACGGPSTNPGSGNGGQSPSPPTRFNIQAGGSHIVVDLSGVVEIEHNDWIRPVPATFGTVAFQRDAFYVHPGSQATVVCADLSSAALVPGEVRNICEGSTAFLEHDGVPISPPLSPNRVERHRFKPIVSPRNTNIRDPHPTIHLAPPDGTTIQVIEVNGGGISQRIDTNGQTAVDYPADAPSLAPGETYTVHIVSPSLPDTVETKTPEGFTLLADDRLQAIAAAEDKIRVLQVSDEAKLVLLANLFLSHHLYADTADLLRDHPATAQQPILSRYLADCYAEMEQFVLAVQHYQHALDISTDAHLQERAYIYEQLADIAIIHGDQPANIDAHRQRALELYEQMGHQKKVDELRQQMPTPTTAN